MEQTGWGGATVQTRWLVEGHCGNRKQWYQYSLRFRILTSTAGQRRSTGLPHQPSASVSGSDPTPRQKPAELQSLTFAPDGWGAFRDTSESARHREESTSGLTDGQDGLGLWFWPTRVHAVVWVLGGGVTVVGLWRRTENVHETNFLEDEAQHSPQTPHGVGAVCRSLMIKCERREREGLTAGGLTQILSFCKGRGQTFTVGVARLSQ